MLIYISNSGDKKKKPAMQQCMKSFFRMLSACLLHASCFSLSVNEEHVSV